MNVTIVKLRDGNLVRDYVELNAYEIVITIDTRELAIRAPRTSRGVISLYTSEGILVFTPLSSNVADVWTEPH